MWLYNPITNESKSMTGIEIQETYEVDPSMVSRLVKSGTKHKRTNFYFFREKPSLKIRRDLYAKETHQGEVWRKYQDGYSVSNYGRIKKPDGTFAMPYFKSGKNVRLFVKLHLDGKSKEITVCTVVAQTFLKQPPNTKLMHKTKNYGDCSVWNLVYRDVKEVHRRTGAMSRSKAVVLIDEFTHEVINGWPSARKAALDVFMSRQTITDRCNGKVKSRDGGWFMWEQDYETLYMSEYQNSNLMEVSITCRNNHFTFIE